MTETTSEEESGLLLVSQFVDGFKEESIAKWAKVLTERIPEAVGKKTLIPTRLGVIRHVTEGLGRRGGKSGGFQVQYLYKNVDTGFMGRVTKALADAQKVEAGWSDSEILRLEDAGALSGSIMEPNGLFCLAVFFRGYRDNYQNDTRRNLVKSFPGVAQKEYPAASITPLVFSLVYGTLDGSGKAIGAQYQYAYKGMDSVPMDDFNSLAGRFAKKKIWESHEILFAKLG